MSIIEHIHKKEENQWRNIATRIVLVLLTTLLIVWFLPRNEGKRFVYEVGEPWHYGTIIAKYDFPIYKTDEALAKEKDSLLKQFQPYFLYDSHVEQANIEKFKRDFAAGLPGLPATFEAIIIDRLHRLYQAGIMGTPNYNNVASADTTSAVRVIFGKNVESILINCVFSTLSAYEQLLDDEALSNERTAVQRLNLNNYIERSSNSR